MEICLKVDPARAPWFGCLLSDEIFLHSILFTAYACSHPVSEESQGSLALYHCATTLGLLRERLADLESKDATSDATIMTVITLAGVAEYLGDRNAARNHREGLSKMVSLRGGLPAMNGYSQMLRTKVCRFVMNYVPCYPEINR